MAKHRLDQKYKPWRKGKSKKASSSKSSQSSSVSSLKNRIRGQKRLLNKLRNSKDDENDGGSVSQQVARIEDTISELEAEVSEKKKAEQERKNAMTYHKVKFFERQKLTRMERKVTKQLEEARKNNSQPEMDRLSVERERIRMDFHYVTHFPNDEKYISLFASRKNNNSKEEHKLNAKQRAIRERIAQEHNFTYAIPFPATSSAPLSSFDPDEKQRARTKSSNTVASSDDPVKAPNKKTPSSSTANDENTSNSTSEVVVVDSRFDTKSLMDSVVLKKQMETEEKEEKEKHDEDANGDRANDSNSNDSDDDSDSSDSSDTTSSDDSDDDEDDNPDGGRKNGKPTTIDKENADDDDDFFVSETAETESGSVFRNAKVLSAHDVGAKGDKSQGWATQKQLPGEFKKRRKRY